MQYKTKKNIKIIKFFLPFSKFSCKTHKSYCQFYFSNLFLRNVRFASQHIQSVYFFLKGIFTENLHIARRASFDQIFVRHDVAAAFP